MSFIYTLCFYCCLPLILLRLLWRGCKAPKYWQRWSERFGFYPNTINEEKTIVWLHSVSVGETIAAKPLVDQLLLLSANTVVVITTTTPTGSDQVQRLFAENILQGRVQHSYIPYDLPDCILRFLSRVQPQLAIFMETELWPNIIRHCQLKDIPTILANGRLSERSYQRYKKLGAITKTMFSSITSIAAQGQADAERMRLLGATEVIVTGNIKLTIAITDDVLAQAQQLKQQWSLHNQRRIIIAASTHDGEESIILSAYQAVLNRVSGVAPLPPLLVVVPRHPERFAKVKQLAIDCGFNTALKSEYMNVDAQKLMVVIGDSMGELMLMYGAANIAIVGGSFVANGGHNMLEPAAWGLPTISGDSVFNFADISQQMVEDDALMINRDEKELAATLQQLLGDQDLCVARGGNAKRYIQQNQGALDKLTHLVSAYLV